MSETTEFRKAYRQDINLLAGIEGPQSIDFAHRTKIRNINMKGMCVETVLDIAIGEKKMVRFFIGSGKSMTMQCRIIWKKTVESGNYIYGFLYPNLDWRTTLMLMMFMRRKKREVTAAAL